MRGVTGKLDSSLFSPGDKVLVACSGGADSLGLLCMLREAAPNLGIRLRAVYVNHGLRPEAAREGEIVCGHAANLGLHGDVVSIARSGAHDQAALRDARYDALEQVRRRTGANKIAVAHTANDQAETVLMRLIRGAGVKGLAGIAPVRGRVVRPLLGMLRIDIERFLADRWLEPVEDPSNAKTDYLRNRIRHELVPWLAAENPRVIEALCDLAVRMREIDGAVDAWAAKIDHKSVAALKQVPAAVRSRALEHAHLDALDRLICGDAGTGEVSLPGGLIGRRSYGQLALLPDHLSIGRVPADICFGETRFGVVAASESGVESGGESGGEAQAKSPPSFDFDAELVPLPWTVRAPRSGDKMAVRGLGGRKKLQDIFVDAKIPADLRPRRPVVVDGKGEILCLPGLRASEVGRPGPQTKRRLLITWLSPTNTKA